MRGGERPLDGDAPRACGGCQGRAGCAAPASRVRALHGTGSVRTARGPHGVLAGVPPLRRHGRAAPARVRRCGGAGWPMRTESVTRSGSGRRPGRRAAARAGRGHAGPPRRAARRSLRHRARRGRTRASGATATISISTCRWRFTKRRSGARIDVPTPDGAVQAARAAGHAIGPAVPGPRARHAVAADGRQRRSRGRGAAGAAAACSTSDRRS